MVGFLRIKEVYLFIFNFSLLRMDLDLTIKSKRFRFQVLRWGCCVIQLLQKALFKRCKKHNGASLSAASLMTENLLSWSAAWGRSPETGLFISSDAFHARVFSACAQWAWVLCVGVCVEVPASRLVGLHELASTFLWWDSFHCLMSRII